MVLLKSKTLTKRDSNNANLHSNMVLLKLNFNVDKGYLLLTFTFQYGTT